MSTKQERISHANAVIKAISDHGRRFFYYEGRTAFFHTDGNGRLRLRDEYTGKVVFLFNGRGWKGFNHGGTMRRLVEDLAEYVRTEKPASSGHFGPWPEWYCNGDLWGYGDDMVEVRELAYRSPAVQQKKEPAAA